MLYLASQSPRRRELLARLGQAFEVLRLEVPERRAAGESPQDYVRRVARDKAEAGLALRADEPEAVVLGADTEVVLDDEVFGKPRDADDAAAMLRRLAGRDHRVISAVCVVAAGRREEALALTEVTFAPLSDDDIAVYLAGGEWQGKAGAYAIQGSAERFVPCLRGSYSGVMGLPMYETASLLRAFGLHEQRDRSAATSDRRSDAAAVSARRSPLAAQSS